MTGHPTTLEKLIDALQVALLRAGAVDQHTRTLSDDSRQMVDAVKHASLWAHQLRLEAHDAGGRVTGADPRD